MVRDTTGDRTESPPAVWHAVVACNGEYPHPERHAELARHADLLVAADGGANWLVRQGLVPHVVVGDLDSVASEVLVPLRAAGSRIVQHARRKDETDTELALGEALAAGARAITIIGAMGGRLDHALANVFLLALPMLADISCRLFDGRSFVSLAATEATIAGAQGDILSLLPITERAEGVRTEGLEYPLCGETLPLGPARGISNVLLAPTVRVTLERGRLLVVHTPLAYLEDGQ